jgi:hypothetical protein
LGLLKIILLVIKGGAQLLEEFLNFIGNRSVFPRSEEPESFGSAYLELAESNSSFQLSTNSQQPTKNSGEGIFVLPDTLGVATLLAASVTIWQSCRGLEGSEN